QIAGISYRIDGNFRAFIIDPGDGGAMKDLGTLGGSYSRAYAINAAGAVVGQAYLAGDASAHAFVYEGGRMADIDTPAHAYSKAMAINGSGVIVGDFDVPNGTILVPHAFVYAAGE